MKSLVIIPPQSGVYVGPYSGRHFAGMQKL